MNGGKDRWRARSRRTERAGARAGSRVRGGFTGAVVLLVLFAAAATGADFERPAIFDRVEEFRLENGMLVLLLPRHDVPSVSGRIRVRVGNVDNPSGETGLAHMFEHMAFKGTDRIGTKDWRAERVYMDSVSAAGSALSREVGLRERGDPARVESLRAEMERLAAKQAEYSNPSELMKAFDSYSLNFNAWTSYDFTNYMTDVPSNNLEAWALLESERIQHPVFREFYAEREVVKEERRSRTDDAPDALARELFYSLAFTAHPYRFPIIGYMSDLETLTQEKAEFFHRTFYVPNNMTIALVGDFDPKEARRLIGDYFGDIPPGPPPPEVATVEPGPLGMRRGVVRKGTERSVRICFPGFHQLSRDAITAEFLSAVLSRDVTSRLDHRLDVEEKAVRRVYASHNGGYIRYPGVFEITAESVEGFTNEALEKMIWEELERVVADPVSEERVDEIRRSFRKSYYYEIETNGGLADELVEQQMVYGDWRHGFRRFEEHKTVTADEVTKLAARLFKRDKATVVYLEPENEAMEDGKGGDS